MFPVGRDARAGEMLIAPGLPPPEVNKGASQARASLVSLSPPQCTAGRGDQASMGAVLTEQTHT